MSKSQFYLSQCEEAASKSPMCFTLGAVLVKGGKVISSGFNHHRPHYDGGEVGRGGKGHRKPISMHAEMHAIFNATGMSPAFKTQVQRTERRLSQKEPNLRRLPGGSSQRQNSTEGVTSQPSDDEDDPDLQPNRRHSQQRPKVEGPKTQEQDYQQQQQQQFESQSQCESFGGTFPCILQRFERGF